MSDGHTGVLIVDDDVTTRMVVIDHLEEAGFEVREAAGAAEGLALFADWRPALVLLDVMMPRVDGYEALRRLRAMPHGEDCPVVMLTGLEDGSSIDRAFECGATDFITKPVNGMLLRHRVRYVIRASRAARDLKAARESALESSRLKSEFVANVSHELRTPLNGVLGMTELLSLTELDDEQREYIADLELSSARLHGMIENLLDFSRIDTDRLELDERACDVVSLLDQAVESARVAAVRKGLQLIVRIGDDVPPRLTADPARLRQVLCHLLDNGVKFTDRGSVELQLERSENGARGELRFTIRDTGVGIPPSRRDSVFDAFTQADGSTSRRHEGAGLGLPISSRLVHLMGGRLWLEGTSDGEAGSGTTFRFTLPLRPV